MTRNKLKFLNVTLDIILRWLTSSYPWTSSQYACTAYSTARNHSSVMLCRGLPEKSVVEQLAAVTKERALKNTVVRVVWGDFALLCSSHAHAYLVAKRTPKRLVTGEGLASLLPCNAAHKLRRFKPANSASKFFLRIPSRRFRPCSVKMAYKSCVRRAAASQTCQ